MSIKNPAADIELQDLPKNEASGTPAPTTTQNDQVDVENQCQKRDYEKLRKRCAKYTYTFGIYAFFLTLFLSFVALFVSFALLLSVKFAIKVYIPQTIDIEKLTPQGQALHKLDYEKLFDETPFMNGFSEIANTQSKNYYKDYAYIQNRHNLSLYINVPKANMYSSQTSIATLVDRSVTTKSVGEIYKAYRTAEDVNTFYHDLYQQQPVHRLTNMYPLYYYRDEIVSTNLGEYVSFLTQFIILFTPVNNKQNDYLSLQSDSEKLSELVSMAVKTLLDIDGVAAALALIITLMVLDLILILSLAFLIFNSFNEEGLCRGNRRVVNCLTFVPISLMTVIAVIAMKVIDSNSIFKVFESAKPFSESMKFGHLEWFRRCKIYFYFEIIRNFVLVFFYSLTYFGAQL